MEEGTRKCEGVSALPRAPVLLSSIPSTAACTAEGAISVKLPVLFP